MSKTLLDIAKELKNNDKKVQLIYAFNGTGKTRLSKIFKELIVPKNKNDDSESELARHKILYYNAFTEDLFYWDNDLAGDKEPKLKIQPNTFTDWVLREQAQDQNIISYFQHYTNEKLTPKFSENFDKVTFSFSRGNDEIEENIKISKGEESNFVWSIFYSLIDEVIQIRNQKENRQMSNFDAIEYIFIDDPVSSLDENHLIELAVDLAKLIKSSDFKFNKIKFIVTTHNSIFYNILYRGLGLNEGMLLEKKQDGLFELHTKKGDSNTSFNYHIYLKHTLENAISNNAIEKYHFTLLRNLYEKTASFLGYKEWSSLLPDDSRNAYYSRIINFSSHSSLAGETSVYLTDAEKNIVVFLLNDLTTRYNFFKSTE
ncbi:anticodon nuclease [Actinobacillus pleuropneumoniae]|uniref:Anticodon nuclease n=2 Tax=Actinobacillus pleuropneumoniae TaxID=715 RepID=B3H0D6_ACTP7|nr:hypothetical protein [Actinobacillus pleuropneumoniae]ACE60948.1 Anticodon nuclease [Actinobacillus pleuropneumoniae serovar 7 str. AP76]EFN03510.1 Anticodon nuclease [Actinobacillus pleuropneumoniae serovar 13 str. N273]UKH17835.1 anticodon nuclease [Actinobacillus pleuropneumoniae]UKH40511.1 anticodon nuclease [Actinobacillus pleuropneumoniae serovar 4 str. M62]SQF64018.1 anticodon nuclease [Actinobacillus pleuropneumoniae]